YLGPEINPLDSSGHIIGTPVPTQSVIQQAFAWLHANGFTGNNALIYSLAIPGFTEKINGSLKSPYMDEVTAGYGVQINADSYVRADLIHRTWGDFYVTRRDLSTGQATTPTGSKVDVGFIENSSSSLERKYNALQLQGQTKLLSRVTVG